MKINIKNSFKGDPTFNTFSTKYVEKFEGKSNELYITYIIKSTNPNILPSTNLREQIIYYTIL